MELDDRSDVLEVRAGVERGSGRGAEGAPADSRNEGAGGGMRLTLLLAALGLMSFVFAACGSRRPVFKPVGYKWPISRGEYASWKQGVLPDGSMDSNFEVFVKGAVMRDAAGVKVPSLLVCFGCTNNTGSLVTFDAAQTHLLDNEGRYYAFSAARVNGGTGTFARIRDGEHCFIEVWYDLPKGLDVSRLKVLTVYYRYTVGRKAYEHSAVFERTWTR